VGSIDGWVLERSSVFDALTASQIHSGYATTVKSAETIAESVNWKQSIVAFTISLFFFPC